RDRADPRGRARPTRDLRHGGHGRHQPRAHGARPVPVRPPHAVPARPTHDDAAERHARPRARHPGARRLAAAARPAGGALARRAVHRRRARDDGRRRHRPSRRGGPPARHGGAGRGGGGRRPRTGCAHDRGAGPGGRAAPARRRPRRRHGDRGAGLGRRVTTRDGRGESLHGLLGRGLAVVAVVLALGLGTTAVAAVQTDRHLDHVTDLFFRTVTEGDLGYLALVEAEIRVRAYAATGDPLTLSAFETYIAGDVFTLEVGHRDLGGELAEHLGDDHPTVAARRRSEARL